jgi:putative ABC transport system ATP-binding protein
MLDAPTTGRYLLNGRPVDDLSHTERARLRNIEIGLIFNLIGDMSVYENVEYPLALRNASAADRHASKRRSNASGSSQGPRILESFHRFRDSGMSDQ